jgi:hypothetical protein
MLVSGQQYTTHTHIRTTYTLYTHSHTHYIHTIYTHPHTPTYTHTLTTIHTNIHAYTHTPLTHTPCNVDVIVQNLFVRRANKCQY